MSWLKRFLVIVGILFLLAAVGVGIFIATFNADRYRPLLVSKLQQAVGQPVRLERLSLGWRGGISVELKGLGVGQNPPEAGKPAAEVESVGVLLKPAPLLKKKIEIERLELKKCRLHLKDQGSKPPLDLTVESLEAKVQIRSDQWKIQTLSARAAQGTITASGSVRDPSGRPQVEFQGKTERLDLEALLAPSGTEEPHLRGRLNLSFKGTAQGLETKQIMQTLSGSGEIQLTEGALVNLNILREVFSRLSILPGLMELLQARLPESYQEKLKARDTLLKAVNLSFTTGQGKVLLNSVRLATDTFELTGSGQFGLLDATVAGKGRLRIEPDLSGAMVRSVGELQALADSQGRLEIPVTLRGTLSRPSIMTDASTVFSQMTVTKGEELLGGLLQKILEKKKTQ